MGINVFHFSVIMHSFSGISFVELAVNGEN